MSQLQIATSAPVTPASGAKPIASWTFAIVISAAAIVCAVLLWLRTPGINGPPNWRWWYRDPPAGFLLWFVLCLAPVIGVMLFQARSRWWTFVAIAVLCVASFAMRLVIAIYLQPSLGWTHIDHIVRSDYATSYYYDGKRLIDWANARQAAGEHVRHWLSLYDEFLPGARVHTRVKPPGAVIYWMTFLAIFGDERAPVAGAVMMMLLASLSPLMVYLLGVRLGISSRISRLAAALMAVAPGFLLSTPAFDPVYPIFTCGLIIAWLNAIERSSNSWAVMGGAIVAVGTLMSLHLLSVGVAVAAGPFIAGRVSGREIWQRTLRLAPFAIAAIVAFYAMLAIAFDYAPIAVIKMCIANQADFPLKDPARYNLLASIFDITDASLGIGWAAMAAFAASLFWRGTPPQVRRLAITAAVTIGLIAVLHLLPAETARVWILFFPLLLIPAAAVMDALPERARVLVILAHGIAVIAACAMLKFVLAG